MRYVFGAVFLALAVSPAAAAVPNPIATLLGPSIGYRMAQSDLCGWDSNDKLHTIYQKALVAIGMTDAQVATVWSEAKTRMSALTSLPEAAIAHMKADICTPDRRAEFDRAIAD